MSDNDGPRRRLTWPLLATAVFCAPWYAVVLDDPDRLGIYLLLVVVLSGWTALLLLRMGHSFVRASAWTQGLAAGLFGPAVLFGGIGLFLADALSGLS